jgi:hypothetical protein
LVGHVAKQLVQLVAVGGGQALQAARERSLIGQTAQAHEAKEQRIAIGHAQVREPAAAEQQHADHDQRCAERAVARIEAALRERIARSIDPILSLAEATEQLESGVARQRLVRGLDRERASPARADRVS